ncbi:hypothetical protein BJY14_003803 [Actinomadura luteofluorescens]|uniref:Uncharacterized protein n=2 Tax=Actinomadura luteofluorescens TaxID=46163 RepID=A0A7Y9EHE9_9ACTN|nr:hypothetical protein [Actinomadura luteofluorescens]NYD47820.1 hypothetical protein [Actinomadura luteofluorescens]
MGVEHPTRTDTKVETDQPGPPGQKSGPEGRDATQQPGGSGTDQKGETPTPARSARAENSNDPNDDPNRIGTPRADSLAIARGEKPEPPADKGETPTPARSIRAENSNDPNDDPNRIGTPRADSLAIARGEKPETPAEKHDTETTAGTPEPPAERPPGTSGTPRADSMAIARGEKLETDENEADAADTDPPDAPMKRPGEAEPPADNREPDSAAPSAAGEQGAETTDTTADAPDPHAAPMTPGEQPLGEQGTEASKQDNPSHPKPQEDQPPVPEAIKTDEPDDVTPEPDDGTGQTPPQDAQPLDHGILDNRAEDVERPAETNPEVADGKPHAKTGEQLGDAPPPPEPEPDAEAPPAPTDGEQPLQPEPGAIEEPEPPVPPEHGAIEEPEPPAELEDDSGSEPQESRDTRAQGAVGEGMGETDDAGHGRDRKAEDPAEPSIPEEANDPFASLPTREDLDPAAAGMWAAHRSELTPVDENQDLTESDPEDEDYSKRIMRALRDNSDDMQKNVNDISSDLGEALPKPPPPKGKTGSSTQYHSSPDASNQGVHGADIAIAAVAAFMVVERTYQFGKSKVDEFTRRRRDDN